MADNIVSGLFGLAPYQIQQQQNQQIDADALQYAKLDPFQRANFAIGRGAGMLTGMGAEAMGLQNPAMVEAQQRQAALQGLKPEAKSIRERALQIQDPRLKFQLEAYARQLDKEEQDNALKLAQEAAAWKRAETEASPMGKVDPAKFTPESIKAWVASGMKDYSLLTPIEKTETTSTEVKTIERAALANGLVKGTPAFEAYVKNALEKMQDKRTHITLNTNGSGALTEDGADTAIDMALAGDPTMMQGWGRSPKDKATITNRLTARMKSGEISPQQFAIAKAQFAGYTASERVLGGQGANIQLSANEANQMMNVVRSVIPEVRLTDYPSLNALQNAVNKQMGGPAVPKLYAALTALVNTYARAINPRGVATVHDKTVAEQMINKAMSEGQLEGVMSIMKQEMDAALASPKAVRETLANERRGVVAPTTPAPAPKSLVDQIPGMTPQVSPVRKYNPATGRIE